MGLIDQFSGLAGAIRALWAGNKPDGITTTAFPVQVRRVRQDVGKWRAALDRAEAVFYPDRTDLLNVYADVVLDAHLASVMQTRKINVLGRPFQVVDAAGKENPALTKLLRRPWFRQACELALDSKFWGHTLMEFDTPVDGEFHQVSLIDRQYVFPEAGIVRTMPGMVSGTDYRNNPQYTPWLLEVGNVRDLGLLLKASPYVIWKKNVLSAWADFTEMFGMPYRTVSGDMDAAQIKAAERMMAEMGQAGYGIFSGNEIKVDFIAPSTGNDKIYDGFIARINSELSKLVLGQTMTTDDGSSLSQANVHERVADAYTRDDSTWLSEWVNEQLLPFLLTHGYPLAGYSFAFDESESLGVEAQWKIVDGILGRGYKVPAAYLTERFGVPIEAEAAPVAAGGGEGDAAAAEARPILGYHIEEGVVTRNEARAQLNLPAVDETEAERERVLTGKLSLVKSAVDVGIPLAEALKLAGMEVALPEPPEPKDEGPDGEEPDDNDDPEPPGKPGGPPSPDQPAGLQARLDGLYSVTACCPGGHAPVVMAAKPDELDRIVEALIKRLFDGDLFEGTIDSSLFAYLTDRFEDAINVAWKADDPALRQQLSRNVARFSGFKTYQVQRAMTDKLLDDAGQIRPFSEFKKDALQVNMVYNQDYLRTEYNHAVASAQMASKWASFDEGAMIRYDTVGDDRVRPEHAAYDGVTLPKEHPWWADHWPPLDWNCRCDATEVDPDATPTPPRELMGLPKPAPLFRNNAGQTGEVFGPEHPYFNVPASIAERIEEQADPIKRAGKASPGKAGDEEKAYAQELVSKVHRWDKLPDGLIIKPVEKLPEDGIGEFKHATGKTPARVLFVPAESRHTTMGTILHELGHVVDYTLREKGGKLLASEEGPSPVSAILRVIHQTQAYKHITEQLPLAGKQKDLKDFAHYRYLSQARELFARAYSQYIALRGGDGELVTDLILHQRRYPHIAEQWYPADFEPVAKAFDQFFKQRKWTPND